MSKRNFWLALALMALLAAVLGCSKSAVEPESTMEEPNLNDEFGGYQAIGESPAFGDDELLTEASESDEEYDDPFLASAGMDTIINDSEAGHYHLRAVWGKLRFDSSSTTPTDWSGLLTITRGAEIIRRVIRFERSTDYIVPRKDRRLIEWVSQTTVHNDGIAVDIFVPRLRPLIDTSRFVQVDSNGNEVVIIVVDTTWPSVEPVTVEFKTGPYSRVFKLDELVSLDTIVYLDDSNAVAFHAIKLDRFPCPRGFLAGAWGFTEDGRGVFRGVWMDKFGLVNGYLKGHFGKRDNGEQVFFGKWISRTGRFEGFIRGHWGYSVCPAADPGFPCRRAGFFNGSIYNANRQEIGLLGGQFYGANTLADSRSGFFQGRWKLFCDDELNTDRNAEEGFE